MIAGGSPGLEGRTIVVTRAREQFGEARKLLEQQGARVLDLPALETVSYTHLTLPTNREV